MMSGQRDILLAIYFLIFVAALNFHSCGSRQAVPQPVPSLIEQHAEPEPPTRAEQVMNALLEAYPNQIEKVEFRNDDWALLMQGAWYYYAEGRLLPENRLENAANYRAVIFYRYPAELPPLVERNSEVPARIRNNRNAGDQNTPRRSSYFMDALWQAHSRAEVYNNIRTINFLGKTARVHNLIFDKLTLVEARILAAAKTDPQVQAWINDISIAESWVWRNIADSQNRSYHSYGIAIDLLPKSLRNRQVYWLWTSQHRKEWWNVPYSERYHHPAVVISAFEAYGFIWGGKWLRFDTMHFEYRPEVLILSGMPPA